MQLENKINAIRKVLADAEKHANKFQKASGINCVPACGICCLKNNIETTVLEFLPAAYQLFFSTEYISILETIENKKDPVCVFYQPLTQSGCCKYYKHRGLICRLFGFTRKTGKNGALSWVTCNTLKSMVPEYNTINLQQAPDMADYYIRLFGIDPGLSTQYLPINQSIKKALEIIISYFTYTQKSA